ncbi:MAG: trigger factor [Tannerellaceae bacterium]
MNVSLKNIDTVNGIINIEIAKADYQPKVDEALKTFRKKANVPGFRKGMAPMGMLKKMYGKSIKIDEINKLVGEKLYGYIRENKINILGEPLPSEQQADFDFETQEDYDFAFDIALAPEIKIDLSKEDKIVYYNVAVDDEMVNNQIDAYKSNFGTYVQVEAATEEKDLVKGTVVELDENNEPKEGGIRIEGAVLMSSYMKNEEEKSKFANAAKNSVIVFNPAKAYENAEAEIASFLRVSKEEAANITSNFSFEIEEITRYQEAQLNQELFDRVFGKDTVTTEEEFVAKVREALQEQMAPESDFRFLVDAKEVLMAKVGDLQFPDAFLKRWLLVSGEDKTPEAIEEEYPAMINDLKFHLIKEQIIKDNSLKVEEADFLALGKKVAKAQFAQYGMISIPEDVLENYAKDMMKDKNTARNIVDRAIEEKIVTSIKEKVSLDEKTITIEEFKNLFA